MKNTAAVFAEAKAPQNDVSLSESEDNTVEAMRLAMRLLNKGVVVQIVDVGTVSETDSLCVVKLQMLTDVGNMPMFGNIKLRLSKMAVTKLKKELARIDC